MVWKRWTSNLAPKLLSAVMAVALWLFATNQIPKTVQRDFPVDYVNWPEALTTLEPLPEKARVSVTGRGRFLYYAVRKGRCEVDLSGYHVGKNEINYREDSRIVGLDSKLDTKAEVRGPLRSDSDVLTPVLRVEFDEEVTRKIPITPIVVGEPAARFTQVGTTTLNPTEARVTGPRQLVDQIALLPTVEIDIQGQKHTLKKDFALEPPPGPTVKFSPPVVAVGITLEPIEQETLENVVLEVAPESPVSGRVTFLPPALVIEIEGARSILETASSQISSLRVEAQSWGEGKSILRFAEARDGLLIFVPYDSFPFRDAPPWDPTRSDGTNGDRIAGPIPPASGRMPPALEGDLTGRLPLPGVSILSISPERLVVVVHPESDESEESDSIAQSPDPSP